MNPAPETPDLRSAELLPPLPDYAPAELASLDPDELVALLVRDEDRAPRSLIDECAARGDAMVERLAMLVAPQARWPDPDDDGEWWLRLHAPMILGLIAGEQAARLLVSCMRRMERANDESLQDWLSGRWPALFRNKPASVQPALRSLAQDRSVDWYMRTQAVQSALALAERAGAEALDAGLDWAAGIAGDEAEDLDLRLAVADTLLDFPRERYRRLLLGLVKEQANGPAFFTARDVAKAYAAAEDRPQWRELDDPWEFYDPAEIAERQARAQSDLPFESTLPTLPYVRETPKIGRNDPCPCGSGKKYKKCCLG